MQDENLNNPLANQEMQPPTDVQTGGGFLMPDDGQMGEPLDGLENNQFAGMNNG